MSRLIKCFGIALCVALACLGSQATASIVSSYLTFDGIEDTLIDESRAGLQDNGDGTLGIGDIIYGVVQITSIQASGVPVDFIPPPTIGAIFSATITAGTGASLTPFLLGPTARTGVLGFGLDVLAPNLDAASLATAAQKAASIFYVGSNPGSVGLIVDTGVSAKANIIAAELALTTGGQYEATAGIAAVNPWGFADFFAAEFSLGNLGEVGGFTIFDKAWGSTLLPVTVFGGSKHDLGLGGLVFAPPTGSVYAFADDASFRINAVPEAVSFLVWAGIVSVAGLAASRRNRSVA